MKVLNLQCSHQHSFEGWFGSEVDFQSQLARRLVECPLCGDSCVQKLPSAPRLNLRGNLLANAESKAGDPPVPQRNAASTGAEAPAGTRSGSPRAEQLASFQALRQVLTSSEDVGDRFADEARAMKYGNAESRSIRGQASLGEIVRLLEEGIKVLPLPVFLASNETLH